MSPRGAKFEEKTSFLQGPDEGLGWIHWSYIVATKEESNTQRPGPGSGKNSSIQGETFASFWRKGKLLLPHVFQSTLSLYSPFSSSGKKGEMSKDFTKTLVWKEVDIHTGTLVRRLLDSGFQRKLEVDIWQCQFRRLAQLRGLSQFFPSDATFAHFFLFLCNFLRTGGCNVMSVRIRAWSVIDVWPG